MTKKIITIVLSLAVIMCLAMGCGSNKTDARGDVSTQETGGSVGEAMNEQEEVQIEGMDNMSDSELNEELIKRADEMPIVADEKD